MKFPYGEPFENCVVVLLRSLISCYKFSKGVIQVSLVRTLRKLRCRSLVLCLQICKDFVLQWINIQKRQLVVASSVTNFHEVSLARSLRKLGCSLLYYVIYYIMSQIRKGLCCLSMNVQKRVHWQDCVVGRDCKTTFCCKLSDKLSESFLGENPSKIAF